ncbi:MAG TPA: nitrilase-related carbon-nitrogen hydrolase [Arthrobacter sp.]|nr:nitrilase-related carbon-nitrogen hydrolase [Arthrobacter sp.]
MSLPSVYCAAGTPGRDPEANLERIRQWASEASAAGAGLLLTPELFVAAEAGGEAVVRERLRLAARTAGVGIVASTPERTGERVFVGADWWDAAGQLVAHVRKRRLSGWQRSRGFSGWTGRPEIIRAVAYTLCGNNGPVGVAFAEDAADPAQAYFLRDHGVRPVLVLAATSTAVRTLAPARPWGAKHTGAPFPQAGPLPEPLLRPLPRFADAWWSPSIPRGTADLGS